MVYKHTGQIISFLNTSRIFATIESLPASFHVLILNILHTNLKNRGCFGVKFYSLYNTSPDTVDVP
jgi:hypothetical protein